MVMATLKTNLTKTKGNISNPRVLSDIGLAILSQKGKYIYKNSYTMSEDIQTALLTSSEIEWLLGKRHRSLLWLRHNLVKHSGLSRAS